MKYLVSIAFAVIAGCSSPEPELPTYGMVSDFSLTDQTGAAFSSDALNGHIWVANFIFTNCDGPCPRMTSQMHQVQDASSDMPLVHMVSFTVDPDRDTPEVLAAYGRRNKADFSRWHFLTGPKEKLHTLKRETFLLGDVDGSLMHSTRFVLVDGNGRIRGFYHSDEQAGIDELIRDLRRLST
jgi:protein SCO1